MFSIVVRGHRTIGLLLVALFTLLAACQGQNTPAPMKSAYMQECERNGVPLPPVWGDPKWVKRGEMPNDKVFDASTAQYPKTEVWVYESSNPRGICYALPRILPDGSIGLLGMICQGKDSSKACFWDNKDPVDNKPVKAGPGLDPARLAGGDTLEEKCVDCHRGDNAFVITPKTPLQIGGGKTDVADPPFQPISATPPRDGWVNEPIPPPSTRPAPPATTGVKPTSISPQLVGDAAGCQSCHTIPKVTRLYCGLVRQMVERKLMPPDGDQSDLDTASDINSLKLACNELTPGSWP